MTGPKRVTEKQLAANRSNAQHSTGPRTPEGRAAVRHSALTHGILAQAVIPEAFDRLLTALSSTFAPANTIEELLVQQVAATYWRLARLYRAEAGAIARRQGACESDLALAARMRALSGTPPTGAASRLQEEHDDLQLAMQDPHIIRARMIAGDSIARDPDLRTADDARIRRAAQEHLAALQGQLADRARHRQAVEDASRSLPPLDTALKYARYETALQSWLDRALSRLERLHRLRGGEAVVPPLHIDVTGVELPDTRR